MTLTYLLTNQRALNQAIFAKKEVYKKLKDHLVEEVEGKKKEQKKKENQQTVSPNGGTNNTIPNTNP